MSNVLEFKKPAKTEKPEIKVDKGNVFEDNIRKNKELQELRKQQVAKENKKVMHDYKLNK